MKMSSSSAIDEHNNNNNNSNEKKRKKKKKKTVVAIVEKEQKEEELLDDDDEQKEEYKWRCDVLKRRSKRLKQLSNIYRDYYWCLIEHLKLKHTHFLWTTPYSSSSSSSSIAAAATTISNNGFCCEVHSCKKKSMALTRFCHAHILSDANQLLYKPCNYPTKSCPSGGGPTLCMKPILKSAVPPLCSNHLDKALKHFTRCLTKEGFTGTNKYPPKFNVIVSEFVRHIQSNRKHNTF